MDPEWTEHGPKLASSWDRRTGIPRVLQCAKELAMQPPYPNHCIPMLEKLQERPASRGWAGDLGPNQWWTNEGESMTCSHLSSADMVCVDLWLEPLRRFILRTQAQGYLDSGAHSSPPADGKQGHTTSPNTAQQQEKHFLTPVTRLSEDTKTITTAEGEAGVSAPTQNPELVDMWQRWGLRDPA